MMTKDEKKEFFSRTHPRDIIPIAAYSFGIKPNELYLEYKADGCAICGYNKCTAAIDFHHIEKENKEYSLSQLVRDKRAIREKKNGNAHAIDQITALQIEVQKGVFLCCRCHREVHAGLHKDGIFIKGERERPSYLRHKRGRKKNKAYSIEIF